MRLWVQKPVPQKRKKIIFTDIYKEKCKNMCKYTMFMDQRSQFQKSINCHEINLQTQNHFNKNPNRYFLKNDEWSYYSSGRGECQKYLN
jgi:hypothetical protein